MGIEIERKFLVRDDAWKVMAQQQGKILKQGYLNSHRDRTVRVRVAGDKAYITVKGIAHGAIRAEYEYEIPVSDAEELLRMCEQIPIEKTRYYLPQEKHTWEIDVFHGQNQGLILAEIELDCEFEEIFIPGWVGDEVTDDIRYYNSYLSNMPYCKWY